MGAGGGAQPAPHGNPGGAWWLPTGAGPGAGGADGGGPTAWSGVDHSVSGGGGLANPRLK